MLAAIGLLSVDVDLDTLRRRAGAAVSAIARASRYRPLEGDG
jgi:hypothetical protein